MAIIIVIFATIILTFGASIYYIERRRLTYWKQKNVRHLKPMFIFGNYKGYIFQKEFLGTTTDKICKKYISAKYVGAFYGTEPVLIVKDPDIIKQVTTKDFYYFSNREISNYTHKEVFTQSLFSCYGDKWKVTRQNLSPLFSSAKMKNMFYLIEKCSLVFEKLIDKEANSGAVEMKSLTARFTMDCICSCGFGVDTNVMKNNEDNNPFKKIGEAIFNSSYCRGIFRVIRSMWPFIFYGLGLKVFPVQIERFFKTMLIQIFEKREYTPTLRNDFIDLILNLKKNTYVTGDSITNLKDGNGKKVNILVDDNFMIAQCIVFFAAGYETSATTLSFTLYELAKHQEVQDKVFNEVDKYLQQQENKLGYDCVTQLPYLEACIDEALRLYPVLSVITREVVEDFTLDGIQLQKGCRIHIPVYHLHHHQDHFPDPEKYQPERFFAENKKIIKPYTYMPFGEGPRICIGKRFAKMQMLAGLITILKKYRVKLHCDTPNTLQLHSRVVHTQPVEELKLQLIERTGWEQRVFKRE